MSDEQQQQLTAEQVLQQLQQQAAANQQAHQKNIEEFVDYSRETQGSDAADSAAQTLVDGLGFEQAQMLAGDLVQYNHPDRLLADLTNDPRLLERFKSMTPHQRAVQLARMESKYEPHGHTPTGTTPAWRATHKSGGRCSDSDWASNYGAGLSDKQWFAEHERRQKLKPIR